MSNYDILYPHTKKIQTQTTTMSNINHDFFRKLLTLLCPSILFQSLVIELFCVLYWRKYKSSKQ